MHILVTNDDGVLAPGLLHLAQEMRKISKVSILAPDRNWSASGHVKTLDRPLRVKEITLDDGSQAWASDGAPSDCVALAVRGFFEEKVDLLVSGINSSANLGHDVTYSGTVTAAMEAAIWGVPAVAYSLNSSDHHLGFADYAPAAHYAGQIAQAVIQHGISPHTLLNVNIPFLPEEDIQGIQITRLGLRVYHDKAERRIDPRGKPYFWTIGDAPTGVAERGTDFGALAEGFVSVTPIQLDLTDYEAIPALNGWEWRQPQAILLPRPVSIFLPG